MDKIAVVGLGKAGLPIAAVIADSGLEVTGVDIDEKRCRMINSGQNPIPEERGLGKLISIYGGNKLTAVSDFKLAGNCKAFIIIVPLFIDKNNQPDFSILLDAVGRVGQILKEDDVVILETTVPPLTTETMIRDALEKESNLEIGDFYLANSPERIMTGYSISRLTEFPKIIGGVNKESGEKAYEVYSKFIPNLYKVSSARLAEFVKVIEGCYRDVNIALSNELLKIAEEIGVNIQEAIDTAKHEYCHLHQPSTGVGGHCIPVYPWFLIKEMERREKSEKAKLLRTAREMNDEMADYWVNKIVSECTKIDKPLRNIKICVKGITFREGVKELYHSRNLEIVRRLMAKDLDVSVYDEMFTPDEIEQMGFKYCSEEVEVDIILDGFKPDIIKR
ncbi:MAG: nucleotide sugar dehydrogenase [Archaeoglobaceae archaeon]